jgi:putative FmdB family regulatory protein
MPIYEYRCAACEAEFEKLVQGAATVVCPACESARVNRRLSVFGTRVGGSVAASAPAASGGCCAGGCGCR